jgi:uncharacterized protein RhaS with RHS repeats
MAHGIAQLGYTFPDGTILKTKPVTSFNGMTGDVTFASDGSGGGAATFDPLNGVSLASYTYDANNRITFVTETYGSYGNVVSSYTYNDNNQIASIAVTYQARTRTEVYTYDESGKVIGVIAEIL